VGQSQRDPAAPAATNDASRRRALRTSLASITGTAILASILFASRTTPRTITLINDGTYGVRVDNCSIDNVTIKPHTTSEPIDASNPLHCPVYANRDQRYLGCLIITPNTQAQRTLRIFKDTQVSVTPDGCQPTI
jgi:hypothetical protein